MEKATPDMAGCYVDGHWGQYANARMVEVAEGFGYADPDVIHLAKAKLASMMPSDSPRLTDSQEEALIDASDRVESWLNENVAPEGYAFGWYDGEFFLESDEWWEDE